ncbi:MAG: hypothetical protein J6U51_00885 [Bacteroidales bacterium]|nr:hypothetical protein [Bacteroidales bacterium]
MNSFNVYGQTAKEIGGNTPVWLGTVRPIPAGATFTAAKGEVYKAGTPVVYDAETKTFEIGSASNANGFLYNDIYSEEGGDATGAIVMYHAEGLLIERVIPEITEEQIVALQAKVPGVLLVRG